MRERKKLKRLAMDKLLLSLSFVVLLTSLTVNSAPMPDSKLISAIEQKPKNIHSSPSDSDGDADDDSMEVENAESVRTQKASRIYNRLSNNEALIDDETDDNDRRREMFIRRRNDFLGETGSRRNKMIGFLPFNALPFGYQAYSAPFYYPSEFYDDFEPYYGGFGEEEEAMSRQSSGNRRRPAGGSYKNSPIYYIRLPPTPYMFVHGLGYISQPPSYTPVAPVPQPISPFFNLPLDFISNGKPTNIYQWGSAAPQFTPQPQYIPQAPQYGGYPSYHQRPQRPYAQRPLNQVNPYLHQSKVTNLKGQYLFNGRPEDIYLLQNPYNPIAYQDPRFSDDFY